MRIRLLDDGMVAEVKTLKCVRMILCMEEWQEQKAKIRSREKCLIWLTGYSAKFIIKRR